jgi:hypothetical protein
MKDFDDVVWALRWAEDAAGYYKDGLKGRVARAFLALYSAHEQARHDARVLAHAYQTDNRPPDLIIKRYSK